MVRPIPCLQNAMMRAWPRLAAIAETLAGLIGQDAGKLPATLPRPAWIAALRLLRPAESLLRRLILWRVREIMDEAWAQGAIPPPPSEAGRSQPGKARQTAPRTGASTPHFSLFEPIPGCGIASGPPPEPKAAAAREPVAGTPETPVSAARLIARFRAFEAALADPETRAAAFARFALIHRQRNPIFRRIHPLRPGWPPGIPSRHTPAWLDDTLRFVNAELRRLPMIVEIPAYPSSSG